METDWQIKLFTEGKSFLLPVCAQLKLFLGLVWVDVNGIFVVMLSLTYFHICSDVQATF